MSKIVCYACGEVGHPRSQCPNRGDFPPGPPAPIGAGPDLMDAQAIKDAFDAHMTVINRYVAQWQSGQISTDEKRRLISAENLGFYGPDCRKALRYP